MPELIFIAGCNSAGKSTFIRTKQSILADFKIFMTDVYKGRTKELVMEALKSGQNVILETVFNDSSFKALTNFASSLGYQTSLIVLFLDSIEQSLKRVALRTIEQTGLLISEGNVKLNFNESFKNISEYFFYFDRIEFFYTGINSVNQFVMSFNRDILDEYVKNEFNYILQFARYALSRRRLDQSQYDIIILNENYKCRQ